MKRGEVEAELSGEKSQKCSVCGKRFGWYVLRMKKGEVASVARLCDGCLEATDTPRVEGAIFNEDELSEDHRPIQEDPGHSRTDHDSVSYDHKPRRRRSVRLREVARNGR